MCRLIGRSQVRVSRVSTRCRRRSRSRRGPHRRLCPHRRPRLRCSRRQHSNMCRSAGRRPGSFATCPHRNRCRARARRWRFRSSHRCTWHLPRRMSRNSVRLRFSVRLYPCRCLLHRRRRRLHRHRHRLHTRRIRLRRRRARSRHLGRIVRCHNNRNSFVRVRCLRQGQAAHRGKAPGHQRLGLRGSTAPRSNVWVFIRLAAASSLRSGRSSAR